MVKIVWLVYMCQHLYDELVTDLYICWPQWPILLGFSQVQVCRREHARGHEARHQLAANLLWKAHDGPRGQEICLQPSK